MHPLVREYAKHHRTIRELDERFQPAGVTFIQAAVLVAIGDGARHPSELTAALDVKSQSMTTLLDRLERDSWLSRAPDPADRRSVILSLTMKGVQALPALRELFAAVPA